MIKRRLAFIKLEVTMNEKWDLMSNEELCLEYQVTNSDDLFNYFIIRNAGYIHTMLGKAQRNFPEQKDNIEQLGRIAIWKSMKRFKAEYGTKFTTLATFYLIRSLRLNWAESFLVRLPIHKLDNFSELTKDASVITSIKSLSSPIGSSNDEDFSLESILVDENAKCPDEAIENEFREKYLKKVLAKLSPRERAVITLRYGLNSEEPKNLREIGDMYDISNERIRQVEKRAMAKLRKYTILDKDDWI